VGLPFVWLPVLVPELPVAPLLPALPDVTDPPPDEAELGSMGGGELFGGVEVVELVSTMNGRNVVTTGVAVGCATVAFGGRTVLVGVTRLIAAAEPSKALLWACASAGEGVLETFEVSGVGSGAGVSNNTPRPGAARPNRSPGGSRDSSVSSRSLRPRRGAVISCRGRVACQRVSQRRSQDRGGMSRPRNGRNVE
jgi:hypothetical protein